MSNIYSHISLFKGLSSSSIIFKSNNLSNLWLLRSASFFKSSKIFYLNLRESISLFICATSLKISSFSFEYLLIVFWSLVVFGVWTKKSDFRFNVDIAWEFLKILIKCLSAFIFRFWDSISFLFLSFVF